MDAVARHSSGSRGVTLVAATLAIVTFRKRAKGITNLNGDEPVIYLAGTAANRTREIHQVTINGEIGVRTAIGFPSFIISGISAVQRWPVKLRASGKRAVRCDVNVNVPGMIGQPGTIIIK